MDFNAASTYIIQRLRRELNPSLSYHCVEHTLDVLNAATRLADLENLEPRAKTLVETAALYHDAGMMIQYDNHETMSVILAKQTLPEFGYPEHAIDEIAGLIMVTKLPQKASNHLEQVICDADLDYLGRDDFYIHSFKLQLEWKVNGIMDTTLDEWFRIQIRFLSEHSYFTKSAIGLRNETKLKHLEAIRQLCHNPSKS